MYNYWTFSIIIVSAFSTHLFFLISISRLSNSTVTLDRLQFKVCIKNITKEKEYSWLEDKTPQKPQRGGVKSSS